MLTRSMVADALYSPDWIDRGWAVMQASQLTIQHVLLTRHQHHQQPHAKPPHSKEQEGLPPLTSPTNLCLTASSDHTTLHEASRNNRDAALGFGVEVDTKQSGCSTSTLNTPGHLSVLEPVVDVAVFEGGSADRPDAVHEGGIDCVRVAFRMIQRMLEDPADEVYIAALVSRMNIYFPFFHTKFSISAGLQYLVYLLTMFRTFKWAFNENARHFWSLKGDAEFIA
ncbi:unnamed protein product [Protopolystoma xenopodis]|uniref:Uncharacterized protein n=1 Tax=Protopolystoma xenopodis TaxID=117903 RepID=A0A448WGQ5_9PLAT|nr:unnamed protein product [Protopolystoma xenopodis]